jgi:hypothetical protein
LIIFTRRDIAYGLVIVWALVGIAVKQSASRSIVTTAETSAVVVTVALVLAILISRFRR